MGWITGILTFILVLVCLFLSLLILAQKPKKDTGGGLAFGGAATDALFGAGSGDMFTKMTKYSATTFFVLVLVLSLINAQASKRRVVDPRQQAALAEKQERLASDQPAATPPAVTTAPPPLTITTAAPPLTLTTTAAAPAGTNVVGPTTNAPEVPVPASPPPASTNAAAPTPPTDAGNK